MIIVSLFLFFNLRLTANFAQDIIISVTASLQRGEHCAIRTSDNYFTFLHKLPSVAEFALPLYDTLRLFCLLFLFLLTACADVYITACNFNLISTLSLSLHRELVVKIICSRNIIPAIWNSDQCNVTAFHLNAMGLNPIAHSAKTFIFWQLTPFLSY